MEYLQNKANYQTNTPVPQNAYGTQNALVPQNKAPIALRRGDNYRAPPSQYLGRDGRRQLSTLSSDDSALITQVLETDRSHDRSYDATPISLKHILQAVDVIFSRVTKPDIHGNLLVPGSALSSTAETLEHHEKALHDNIMSSFHDNHEIPITLFNAISNEIFTKWLSGEDANKTTMDILHIVQHYDWDEKVVLTLGAFSVKDGEFWLVAQLYTSNALAKAIGTLKQLPEILERASTVLKSKFDAYNNLVNTILKVTTCIVQLQELHRDPHLTTELESTTSHIPTAVYWTIRSIVVAASQLLAITGMGPDFVTEAWELSSLSHKLENIHGHLEETLRRLHDIIQKKKDDEALAAIAYILETPHIDNTKTLRVLFYKDDQPALYDGYNKRRVDIDVLKRKVVILFLSDLDVAQENEYLIADQLYAEKRQFPTRPESQYEIVWVPIVDNWTEAKYQQFETLRNGMEWYSVFHPSFVSPTVIRYMRKKDKWNYVKKPLLVVIDPQGKIVHTNAVHMMCVFGSAAYPFTNNREKLLWEEETWRIELLADSLDQNLVTWIQNGKFICLYGGEDIAWIRDFTRAAKSVAIEAGIQLELLYVGKSKAKEQKLKNIIRIIEEEKLSHALDWNLIWFFWIRLESMWQSKGQLLKNELMSSSQLKATDSFSLRNDPVLKGIISLLSFGSTERGWAVIGTGSADMSKANGEHMLKSMKEYAAWQIRRRELGFTPALNEFLAGEYERAPHHCTSLILPATGLMPEMVACAECGRLMERYTMFRCCTD